MFDAYSLTDYLALMFGIYLVAAGIGLLQEREAYGDMINVFKENAALGYLGGLMAFAAGLVLVRVHNIWGDGASCLISLIGWASLIEGVLMLAFRRQFLGVLGCIRFTPPIVTGFAILCLIAGGWLLSSVLL